MVLVALPGPYNVSPHFAVLLTLYRLQAVHGNKWKLIGDRLERSEGAVRQRYTYIKRKEKTGLLEHGTQCSGHLECGVGLKWSLGPL